MFLKIKKVILLRMNNAMYDPVNDKIIGAEPGTKSWYHEDRHRQQYKAHKTKIDILDFLLDYFRYSFSVMVIVYLGLPFPLFKIILYFAGIVLAVLSCIELALEFDAEVYAQVKQNENRKIR